MELKIFQPALKFLATHGITPQNHPFNWRNLLILVVFVIGLILICSFLFVVASTFKEYTESIYVSSVGILIFSMYLNVIWNKANIFQFIDCWEKIADKSKFLKIFQVEIQHCLFIIIFSGSKNPSSKAIYVKVVNQVEKLRRFIHFAFLKVTLPCIVLPKNIFCFYIYFTTDAGNDAFELPLPIW